MVSMSGSCTRPSSSENVPSNVPAPGGLLGNAGGVSVGSGGGSSAEAGGTRTAIVARLATTGRTARRLRRLIRTPDQNGTFSGNRSPYMPLIVGYGAETPQTTLSQPLCVAAQVAPSVVTPRLGTASSTAGSRHLSRLRCSRGLEKGLQRALTPEHPRSSPRVFT